MSAALRRYAAGSACTKCGAVAAATTYLQTTDTLRRSCRNCGYLWSELPHDRPRDDTP